MPKLFESVQLSQALLDECEQLDTASLSDALDSLGVSGGLLGITTQVPGSRCVGIAFTVQYEPVGDSHGFKNAANYIDQVPPGAVIVSSKCGAPRLHGLGRYHDALRRGPRHKRHCN